MFNQSILQKPQQRIAVVYLLVAGQWILFSDSILYFFGIDEELFPGISIFKGVAFVCITSWLLYIYANQEFERRFQLEIELQSQIDQVKQSQEDLLASEARYRILFNGVTNPIIVYDNEARIKMINKAAANGLGIMAEEAIGRSLSDFIPQKYEVTLDRIQQVLSKQEPIFVEDYIEWDGPGTWFWSIVQPIIDGKDETPDVQIITYDITERKRSEAFFIENERLRTLFQKEQNRNTSIEYIISALSHDIRTPLTVISTSIKILSHYYNQISEEKRKHNLNMIERQVHFMEELLEDTVAMVHEKMDNTVFRPTPTNISALCQISVDELQIMDDKRERIKFVNLDATETANIDAILVSRVLVNLLSNALKYSPNGKEVRLELSSSDKQVTLRIVDHGIGIHKDDIPNIFDPFFRTKNVGSISGTGLGLSIVKDCIDRHQGNISIKSTPGKGTVFIVELPIHPSDEKETMAM